MPLLAAETLLVNGIIDREVGHSIKRRSISRTVLHGCKDKDYMDYGNKLNDFFFDSSIN